MARSEYVTTMEISLADIRSLKNYNDAIRQNAVDTLNPTALSNVLYGMTTGAIKYAVKILAGGGITGTLAKKAADIILDAMQKWIIESEKSDVRLVINQGSNALNSLASTVSSNSSWQMVRVQVGVMSFSEGFSVITDVGNIVAVMVNGGWQN